MAAEGKHSHNEVEISPYLGHIRDNCLRRVLPNVGLFQAKMTDSKQRFSLKKAWKLEEAYPRKRSRGWETYDFHQECPLL